MPATPENLDRAPIIDGALALHWLMPLHYFYERRGVDLPPLQFIDGSDLPEIDRDLLVHDRDMTPTLARFHSSELRLEVLDKEQSDNYLLRVVILRRRDNLKPVECGAIAIHLDMFESPAREAIEEGQIPLGGVLEQENVPHFGRPRGFFRVKADEIMAHALGEAEGTMLYGRCNELSFPDGIAFADIVEVLPKMD